MNRNELFSGIVDVLVDVKEGKLKPTEIREDSDLKDELGIDSIMGLEIFVMIEEKYSITCREEDFEGVDTPGHLVDLIITKKEVDPVI